MKENKNFKELVGGIVANILRESDKDIFCYNTSPFGEHDRRQWDRELRDHSIS